MITLALDLGTRTGWATQDGDAIQFGYEDFKVARGSGGGMRFVQFRNWLNSLVKPDQVVYEMVMRHVGTDAAHVYGGFLAILTAWCEERSIPYYGIGVTYIKKKWTGKGNASKEVMITETQRRGYAVNDNNEADAVAILMVGLETISA